MRKRFSYPVENVKNFREKAVKWISLNYDPVCILDNNNYQNYQYHSYNWLIAFGKIDALQAQAGTSFSQLKQFKDEKEDWLFGFLTYDLKNEIEDLFSSNFDGIGFPDLYFFQPEHILTLEDGQAHFYAQTAPDGLFHAINNYHPTESGHNSHIDFQSRYTKESYINTVQKVKEHIARGDIFEVNLCQEFYVENVHINPVALFERLNEISKAPFSCFFKQDDKYLISASPERFLKKVNDKLVSQPIKGTIQRGTSEPEDVLLKNILQTDAKELAENVMIVDLVRNDLSRSCKPGSVEVEQLYEVKTFEQVHQLVSTVKGQLREDIHFVEAIKNAFPMGSMTGAPKVRAMELIEQYEKSKRGLYSGAVGYITPEGNFDFNVVIRSILYNEAKRYLSFQVGGAITYDSIPKKEYEECLLKAKALKEVLQSNLTGVPA